MGKHTDEHDACIGRAFRRRKSAQKEVDSLSGHAKTIGNWLGVIAARLKDQPDCLAAEENGIVVLRKSGPVHTLLGMEKIATPVPLPSTEEVVGLFNQIADLRQEIRDLDDCLS